jgi:hypothetical protein
MHRVPATLIAIAWLTVAAPASAQPDDFAGLRLKPGDQVFVTDSTGTETSGPLTWLSPSMLVVNDLVFEPREELKIERAGDSLWNGAAIGAALGAARGGFQTTRFCGGCSAIGSLLGALAGAAFDAHFVGRTVLYDRSRNLSRRTARSMPVVDARRKAASTGSALSTIR